MSENSRFNISHLIRNLRKSNKRINRLHNRIFPKEEARWLSHYKFKKERITIHDNGFIPGGILNLICSTIDFSFIRSLVADAYSIFGGPCYDPVSLFLLDLFRYLDNFRSTKDFIRILRDPFLGQYYRRWAGITQDAIPCEAT